MSSEKIRKVSILPRMNNKLKKTYPNDIKKFQHRPKFNAKVILNVFEK